MVVADHLYRNHPDLPEGDLTRTRAALGGHLLRLLFAATRAGPDGLAV